MISNKCLQCSEVEGVGCADQNLPQFFFRKDVICKSVSYHAAESFTKHHNQNEVEVRSVVQRNQKFHVADR